MDREALDRLLLDRSLGALSSDVEALLAAQIETDPSAQQRWSEYASVTTAARQVLHSNTVSSLPPFPSARIQGLERTRRQLVLFRRVAGLAAALVVGTVLGSWWVRPAAPALQPDKRPAFVHQASGDTERAGRSEKSDFWSIRRLHQTAQASARDGATRVIWDSPVSRPRIGGEL